MGPPSSGVVCQVAWVNFSELGAPGFANKKLQATRLLGLWVFFDFSVVWSAASQFEGFGLRLCGLWLSVMEEHKVVGGLQGTKIVTYAC